MKDFKLADIKPLIDQALKEVPTGNQFLDDRYVQQFSIVGHTNPYYKLFYLIAQKLQPARTVELGGWRGTGAAHFAGGYPQGMVVTIDHHSDPGDDINQQEMFKVVREFPNVNYVQGWTAPGYAEEYHKGVDGWPKVKSILGNNKIDILFIDSWHEYRYLKRDWEQYYPLLADPALVIIDDIGNQPPTIIDIDKFWAEVTETAEGFMDSRPHPGVPMGFVYWGSKKDDTDFVTDGRHDSTPKPPTAKKPTTRKSVRGRTGKN